MLILTSTTGFGPVGQQRVAANGVSTCETSESGARRDSLHASRDNYNRGNDGLELIRSNQKKGLPMMIFAGALEGALIGAVVGGVIGLIVAVIRMVNQKEDGPDA